VTARFIGWGADNEDSRFPAPHEIVVVEPTGRQVLKLDKLEKRWAHTPHCASPSFRLVGVHPSSRVMLFHQRLGRTSHGCDGVEVPHDWRIVKF
jgi:hypothetical protein